MKQPKLLSKAIYLTAAILIVALVIAFGAGQWVQPGSAVTAAPALQQTVARAVAAPQSQAASLLPDQETLARLYETTAPSVVNIRVTVTESSVQSGVPEFPFGFPFTPPQTPRQAQAEGTGFLYDNQGHIVTNNHVVENADSITVYFYNGMWADAELVATDPYADLAVLQVEIPAGLDLQPLPLAQADSLRVGHYVVALGSPFGLEETMTMGIVSALGRSLPTGDSGTGGQYSLPDVIQTDAAINPGNSGGPLLNLNGEVVGVNFAINSPVRANSGVGFAIPVSVVQKVVPALIQDGAFKYAYLGIAGQTINADVAKEENLPANTLGVLVQSVVRRGPADEAGVQEKDIVVGIGEQPVTRFEDLLSYLFNHTNPGDTVPLQILRNGDEVTLEVTLGERPGSGSQGQTETAVSLSDAIDIAKQALERTGLMTEFDSASAEQQVRNGRTIWLVSLSGQGKEAIVAVDAETGEVLGLSVQ